MQLRQDNTQRQAQVQKIGPHLIHANFMLQCSTTELLQIIEREQQENPALEADGTLDGPGGCGRCPLSDPSRCRACPYRIDSHPLATDEDRLVPATAASDDFEQIDRREVAREERHDDPEDYDFSRYEFDSDSPTSDGGQSEFDPLTLAQAPTTLADQLLSHLRAAATRAMDVLVAEYLVDCLDDRGYLHVDENEACAVLGVSPRDIEEGIRKLQACDPPGIGARDLRECLMLQLRSRREQGDEDYDPVAEQLVCQYWDSLLLRRPGPAARHLGVTAERIMTAIEYVRKRLTPHPASQFRLPWNNRPDNLSAAIRPDVAISRTLSGFKIELIGFDGSALQVNPYYRSLYDTIRNVRANRKTMRTGLTPDHEKHVVAYVERADLFVKILQRRRRTILRISSSVVEFQQGFLETGNRSFLRPFSRTQLAQQLDMHESTVSRALLNKYVQLPSQEVVSFDIFFGGDSSAKEAVANLIAAEDPASPLSDQAITELLGNQGFPIARRTVVKYREALRIPASYLRRRR